MVASATVAQNVSASPVVGWLSKTRTRTRVGHSQKQVYSSHGVEFAQFNPAQCAEEHQSISEQQQQQKICGPTAGQGSPDRALRVIRGGRDVERLRLAGGSCEPSRRRPGAQGCRQGEGGGRGPLANGLRWPCVALSCSALALGC